MAYLFAGLLIISLFCRTNILIGLSSLSGSALFTVIAIEVQKCNQNDTASGMNYTQLLEKLQVYEKREKRLAIIMAICFGPYGFLILLSTRSF
ncbi:MAG: hypothetical protein VB086_05830 [Clostridiaceae bacterium]|nr:hypothetical protein [Clostridiaceae bacterium]